MGRMLRKPLADLRGLPCGPGIVKRVCAALCSLRRRARAALCLSGCLFASMASCAAPAGLAPTCPTGRSGNRARSPRGHAGRLGDASRERCGASGPGPRVVGREPRGDAIKANPQKPRNIRIIICARTWWVNHLRRGLRRRIQQRGRGRRRPHGRRQPEQSIREVVARHVERVPQRLEDGELDGQ